MQYKTRTALAAVATVLAHPFRALFAASKPHLTLTAPTLAPRGGRVDILADLGDSGTIDTSPTLREIVAATRGRSSAARSAPMSAAIPRR